MTAYVGCSVKICTEEGDFQGSVFALEPNVRRITLNDVVLLPSGKKVRGIRHFFGDEIDSLEVVGESGDDPNQNAAVSSKDPQDAGAPSELIPEGSTLPGVTVIKETNDVFQNMVSELWEEGMFGMAIYGPGHERFGQLSLLLIRTMHRTYLIDALLAAPAIFIEGLATVLESNEVLKVIHDCRWASDLLYHQFSVKLTNVFDTQVADVLINKQRTGDLDQAVSTLPDCLLAHQGEDLEQVLTMNQLELAIQANDWLQRPLKNELIDFALESVRHLLSLRRSLLSKLFAEFKVAVNIYLSTERDTLHHGRAVTKGKVKHLPASFNNWHRKLPSLLEAEHNKMADRLDDRVAALPGDNLLRRNAGHRQSQEGNIQNGSRPSPGPVATEGMASSTDSALRSQDGESVELRGAELIQVDSQGGVESQRGVAVGQHFASSEGQQPSLINGYLESEATNSDRHQEHSYQRKESSTSVVDKLGSTCDSNLDEEVNNVVPSPQSPSELIVCFGRGRPKSGPSPPKPGRPTVSPSRLSTPRVEYPAMSPSDLGLDEQSMVSLPEHSAVPPSLLSGLGGSTTTTQPKNPAFPSSNQGSTTSSIQQLSNPARSPSNRGMEKSQEPRPRHPARSPSSHGMAKPPAQQHVHPPRSPPDVEMSGSYTSQPGLSAGTSSGMGLSDEIRRQKGRGRGSPVEKASNRSDKFMQDVTNGRYGRSGFKTRSSMDFPTTEEIHVVEKTWLDRLRSGDDTD